MRHAIAYGTTSLELDIPDRRLVGVMSPRAVEALPDVAAAAAAAAADPIGSPPLDEILAGRRTALLVTVDQTRPSPHDLLVPVLAACERHDVEPTIIIATGRHRQMTAAELDRHLGTDITGAVTVLQHDPFDADLMVERGTTERGTPIRVHRAIFEHDLVIGAGIIEPSYLMGWSGGRKLLMPGLAWHEAIDNNHFYLTHPDTEIGRLAGNPVSDDAAEFVRELPLHFIVYAISGPNDEAVEVVAGHAVEAHAEACRRCDAIYRVERQEADIVVSTAGGHPYDCDLVQGKKAIIPAIKAVKRNGVIVLCAACPDGLGAEGTFVDWLTHKTPVEVVRDVKRRELFNLGAHGANILARPIVEKNARVVLVTDPAIAEQIAGSYVITTTTLDRAWQLAELIAGEDASVLVIDKARRLIT